MDIYASDEEKGEAIKQWWRDNGRNVVLGVALVIAVVSAGRYWISHQQLMTEKAALTYHQVLNAVSNENTEETDTLTQSLITEYANTPYSTFAAFEMATRAITNKDIVTATTYYQWVVENAKSSAHQQLAHLRLAALYFDESNYDVALNELEKVTSDAFLSLADELKGDILSEQDQTQLARDAYTSAMAGLSDNEPRFIAIQMKLDNLVESKKG